MAGPNEERPATYLAVTNTSQESLAAAFHGDLYEWASGETLNLSQDAARHIFGFGMEDKSAAFHRLGWLTTRPEHNLKTAMAKLAQIHFAPVKQVFELNAGAPNARRGRKVSGSDRSLAAAGVSSGDETDISSPAAPDEDGAADA